MACRFPNRATARRFTPRPKSQSRHIRAPSTTTNPDWLHNAHAGELLVSEFMEPIGLDVRALAEAIAFDPAPSRR